MRQTLAVDPVVTLAALSGDREFLTHGDYAPVNIRLNLWTHIDGSTPMNVFLIPSTTVISPTPAIV